ncbi:MAG: sulfatase-like hydrolase/transferase [Saprospiraceae bacterium]|nr:sulfatase-like hydrolase/transferase [Saprospiraceae bacterium]
MEFKNIKHNKWAYRDIIGQDPLLGIFKSSRINFNNFVSGKKLSGKFKNLTLKKDAPNVIIIICDALRDDHISLNDYHRKTTPFLDSLSEKLCNFYNSPFHTSSCTSTFCGVISTLYGVNFEELSSTNLGIHDLLHYYSYKLSFILSGSHRSYYNLTDYYGKHIDNYFESKDIKYISPKIPASSDRTLLAYLNSTQFKYDKNEKQFMYFHVMAPHEISFKENIVYSVGNKNSKSDLINDYDNGVIQADNILRDLYYNLKNKGLLENSMLIITSDHGQALNQTKNFLHYGHGFWPIAETINIPLLIIDRQNNYRNDYSTKIDLYPTITDRCFENPEIINMLLPGISLLKKSPTSRKTFHLGELRNYGEPSVSIIESSNGIPLYKYLFNPSDKKAYLFDLKASKGEEMMIQNDSILNILKNDHHNYLKMK